MSVKPDTRGEDPASRVGVNEPDGRVEQIANKLEHTSEEVSNAMKLAYDDRAQSSGGMMTVIIGLVVAVSVGLVVAFNLLPTIFESWDTLQTDGNIPSDLAGIVDLIPVFGILAIALVFLGALMKAVRSSNGRGGM